MNYHERTSSFSSSTSTITELPADSKSSSSRQPLLPPQTSLLKLSKSSPSFPSVLLAAIVSPAATATTPSSHRTSNHNSTRLTRLTRFPTRTPATVVKVVEMRTRSSRLFIILLHLVGISTNVPSSKSSTTTSTSAFFRQLRKHRPSFLTWSVGIVGVHPTAILLERLNVESSPKGLRGILQRVEKLWGWNGDQDLLGEPYWFQDNIDGKCLGPGGFSECGDATLWRVRRRPLTKKELGHKRQKEQQWRRERQRKVMKEQQRNERRRVRERKQYQGQHGQKRQRPSVCVWPFFCEEDSQFQQPPAAALSDSMDEDDDDSSGYNMEEDGFALQLMDVDAITANSSLSSSRAGFVEDEMLSSSSTTILHKAARGYNAGRRFFWSSNKNLGDDSIDPHSECLLSFPSTNSNNGGDALRIGPCSSEDAWIWHVNRDGILVRGLTKSERRRKKRRWGSGSVAGRVLRSAEDELGSKGVGCIHRANSTAAILRPCNDDGKKEDATKVGFSLVRYPSASSKVIPQSSTGGNDEDPLSSWAPWTTLEGPGSTEGTIDTSFSETAPTKMEGKEEQHLPTSRTNSQNHASGSKQRQVEVKSTESMLRTTLATGGSSKSQNTAKTSASHIRDAPFAMQGLSFNGQRGDDAVKKSGGGSNTPGISKPRVDESVGLSKSSLLHKPRPSQARRQLPNDLGTLEGGNEEVDSNPHRPRKIPKHPYIEASNEGIWKDPLTSLEYPTDLCDYLGQSKKEAGRHTLMGVGQYYRTAFNIKVYGAALYVSKRDVLADPKFAKYAALSSDELRTRDDFYEHLMNMPSPDADPATSPGGFFDRTLFIKLNMQLSTDAMRKSLEADWSLMTDEMKELLIGTSFRERMADERMIQKIKSKENSSNCSCGQSAPPEYAADASCCARGTELVFTWRKNGDFEVRLDGRVMDTFPRPDMAKGIFTEYLNNEPISLDAKGHFADGFPFLLAPLAQVRGMSSAVPKTQEPPKKIKSPSSNPVFRLMGASVDAVNSQAHTLTKWMHDGAAEMTSHIERSLDSAVGVARGLSGELDRQRLEMVENALLLQEEGMKIISSYMKSSIEGKEMMALTIVDHNKRDSNDPFSFSRSPMFDNYNEDTGFGAPIPEIMPDEIGIKIDPTMNFTHRLFFTTVHIYLILLLVVSLPGSYTTRLVVKRRLSDTKKYVSKSQSFGTFALNKLRQ